ncbi:translation initiation factor IF-2 subunit gamma [Candidatus Bathyarchaeota archaeon]|nr:translation initiation factor IF-2 subunit gamma [Candidatus Bathyarchaeota archaeon]
MDETFLINDTLIKGSTLREAVEKTGKLILFDGEGRLFFLPSLKVQSLNDQLELVTADAFVYIQQYNGSLLRIKTECGRRITVTPSHPLLVNRNGKFTWIKANRLETTDRIAVVSDALNKAPQEHCQLDALARGDIAFDLISSIKWVNYNNYVIDLFVPNHQNFIAGSGGVVCHNTTLVQALTGVWAARHSEELRRGITIKIGYADTVFYRCPNCPPPKCYTTKEICPYCNSPTEILRAVSFVDCPGHEILMTTMLAGAAVMDGAILVIAANEPVPQPQTREHLAALEIIGVKNIVIVQSKIDVVSREQALENYHQILKFIKGTPAEGAPIIPTSAQHGINLDVLIQALEEHIPTPPRDLKKPPRMYVVRSFDVNKPGTSVEKIVGGIIGGTILQGVFKVEDEIEISPGLKIEKPAKGAYQPLQTRITSLHAGGRSVPEAKCGGLVGVGTYLDPALTKADGLVGNVVGKPGTLPPVLNEVTMKIDLFKHAIGTPELIEVEPPKLNEPLVMNVGTAVTVGTVIFTKADLIEAALKRPICVDIGSRVAISRRIADRWRLIGYGIIQ